MSLADPTALYTSPLPLACFQQQCPKTSPKLTEAEQRAAASIPVRGNKATFAVLLLGPKKTKKAALLSAQQTIYVLSHPDAEPSTPQHPLKLQGGH